MVKIIMFILNSFNSHPGHGNSPEGEQGGCAETKGRAGAYDSCQRPTNCWAEWGAADKVNENFISFWWIGAKGKRALYAAKKGWIKWLVRGWEWHMSMHMWVEFYMRTIYIVK